MQVYCRSQSLNHPSPSSVGSFLPLDNLIEQLNRIFLWLFESKALQESLCLIYFEPYKNLNELLINSIILSKLLIQLLKTRSSFKIDQYHALQTSFPILLLFGETIILA